MKPEPEIDISFTTEPFWVDSCRPPEHDSRFPALLCKDRNGPVDPHSVRHTVFEIDFNADPEEPLGDPLVESQPATRVDKGHWSIDLPHTDRIYALRWEIQPRFGDPVFDLVVPAGEMPNSPQAIARRQKGKL
jgi:hypothetical protein